MAVGLHLSSICVVHVWSCLVGSVWVGVGLSGSVWTLLGPCLGLSGSGWLGWGGVDLLVQFVGFGWVVWFGCVGWVGWVVLVGWFGLCGLDRVVGCLVGLCWLGWVGVFVRWGGLVCVGVVVACWSGVVGMGCSGWFMCG